MRVFIAGATGRIGLPLAKALLERGHQVIGIARTAPGLEKLAQLGAEAVQGDVFDRPALLKIVREAAPEVVLHMLSDLPPRLRLQQIAQDTAPTNHLRSMGSMLLIDAARQAGVQRFITQSSAAIYYPDPSGAAAVEIDSFYANAPGGFDTVVKAISEMEWQVLQNGEMQGVSLRYGHLYGPGTAYDKGGFLYEDVRRRRIPLAGSGKACFSFIHLDDLVRATRLAVESNETGAFNICDDHPVHYAEWLPWFASLIKAKRPMRIPLFLVRWIAGEYGIFLIEAQRGASNQKAKARLGWTLKYPHWRDGFTQLHKYS